jgi:hypothetical protein
LGLPEGAVDDDGLGVVRSGRVVFVGVVDGMYFLGAFAVSFIFYFGGFVVVIIGITEVDHDVGFHLLRVCFFPGFLLPSRICILSSSFPLILVFFFVIDAGVFFVVNAGILLLAGGFLVFLVGDKPEGGGRVVLDELAVLAESESGPKENLMVGFSIVAYDKIVKL